MAGLERRDRAADLAREDVAGDPDDAVDREPELLEDRSGRRRCAEMIETYDRSLVADPAVPAERDARFDRDPGPDGSRQHGLSIGGVLELEPLPAGERHDPRRDAVRLERLGRAEGELELG